MTIKYIKEHIGSDINSVKREYGADVSPEIGKVIKNFMSDYKNESSEKIFFKFMNVIHGLEGDLRKQIGPVSLHETIKGGFVICVILRKEYEEKLRELENYIDGLAGKVI